MVVSHLLIGIVGLFWGLGMVYFSKREKIPVLVRPFLFADWIKNDQINRAIARFGGYASIFVSTLFLLGGLLGSRIWPVP